MKSTLLFKPNGEFNGSIGAGKYNIPTSMKLSGLDKGKLIEKAKTEDGKEWSESYKPFNDYKLYWENYAKSTDERIGVAWQNTEDIQWYRYQGVRVQAVQIQQNPYWASQWLRVNGYDAISVPSSIELLIREYTEAEVSIKGSDGTHTSIKKNEWLVKSPNGNFFSCQDHIFHKEYLSEGIIRLSSYYHSESYDWTEMQVGRNLAGKLWIREGGGDSTNDIEDFEWKPLNDMAQLNQLVDYHLTDEPAELADKAEFIANVQGLFS